VAFLVACRASRAGWSGAHDSIHCAECDFAFDAAYRLTEALVVDMLSGP
jgi:hypothetical protein